MLTTVFVPDYARSQIFEPSGPVKPQTIETVSQSALTGDWALRAELEAAGVALAAHFIAEPADNTRGVYGTGPVYSQQIDFGATLDFNKLGWASAGTVTILFSDRIGRLLANDRTGAYFQNQTFYSQGQNFRLDEIDYGRSFLSGLVDLRVGFYNMGDEFGALLITCNLTSNAFCGHPLPLFYGSAWPGNPTGQWGGRVKLKSRSGFYLETGLYDATPDRKTKKNGFDVDFDNTTGVITPLEVGWAHGRQDNLEDYPGGVKLGAFYDSSTVPDIANPNHMVQGRSGGYLQGAQQVWRVAQASDRGLSLFAVATLNDRKTGLFTSYYEFGASWRGPFANRVDDIVSLGWADALINSRLSHAQSDEKKPAQSSEQIVELNYGAQAAPWLLVRPSVQFVVRPGGYDTRPNAFVFVLHLQATL